MVDQGDKWENQDMYYEKIYSFKKEIDLTNKNSFLLNSAKNFQIRQSFFCIQDAQSGIYIFANDKKKVFLESVKTFKVLMNSVLAIDKDNSLFIYSEGNHKEIPFAANCELEIYSSYQQAIIVIKSKNEAKRPKLLLFSKYEEDLIPLEGYSFNEIKDMGIFNKKIYAINENSAVLQADIPQELSEPLKFQPVENLQDKKIERLFFGPFHMFFLQRETVGPISTWSNQLVFEWLTANPHLDDNAKIAKHNKITGQQIQNADNIFLKQNFGLTDEKKLQVFFTEVAKYQSSSYRNQSLFALGNNKQGQCFQKGHGLMKTPTKLNFSFFNEFNTIEQAYLGTNKTLLYTTEKKYMQSDLKDEKMDALLDSFHIFDIQIQGKEIFILGCPKIAQKKIKFKPAVQIIDRIVWDPSLEQTEFTVGYKDRFLGILETPFDQYLKSDVKDHRIMYIKRKNKIVWDREKRVNLL